MRYYAVLEFPDDAWDPHDPFYAPDSQYDPYGRSSLATYLELRLGDPQPLDVTVYSSFHDLWLEHGGDPEPTVPRETKG